TGIFKSPYEFFGEVIAILVERQDRKTVSYQNGRLAYAVDHVSVGRHDLLAQTRLGLSRVEPDDNFHILGCEPRRILGGIVRRVDNRNTSRIVRLSEREVARHQGAGQQPIGERPSRYE